MAWSGSRFLTTSRRRRRLRRKAPRPERIGDKRVWTGAAPGVTDAVGAEQTSRQSAAAEGYIVYWGPRQLIPPGAKRPASTKARLKRGVDRPARNVLAPLLANLSSLDTRPNGWS